MNRIRLLPEQVANQIAAGEVIERPASIVKELVENALDAGAGRVTVDVQAGGRSLVRVTDDGAGMSRDDALLAFERHATSKICRAEDLAAIATMGFRGEALPSIASVSRLTLTTRERDGDAVEATQVVIHGGKILEVKSAGGPTGTSIEVRQLFFNLPARRKFLRSEETERAHIHHYLTLAALAYPEVAFTFTHEQRVVWQLPAVPPGDGPAGRLAALRERLRALYGGELSLLTVDFTAPLPAAGAPPDDDEAGPVLAESANAPRPAQLRVWGFIGAPGVSRATREDQHLFVNRRPVEHPGLNFALLEGFHNALMKGRYPICCLFLELDPALVDVNIHPAKREVRFRDERVVRAIVTQAVRRTLLAFHTAAPAERMANPPSSPPPAASKVSTPPPVESAPATLPAFEWPGPVAPVPPRIPATPAAAPHKPAPLPSADVVPAPRAITVSAPSISPVSAGQPAIPSPTPALPLLSVPLRLVGVIGRLYVVLESDRGLVLLDQHAAHERILFEQMLARLETGAAPSQRLLLAETVELAARDAQFLREQLPVLNRLGVGLSEFGDRTFLLDALPPFVQVSDARRFVLEIADELKAAGKEVSSVRLGEDTIAKTVCRHAVKAHDPLAGPELERLVEDLRRCAMPYTCPHGRPTLIELGYRELEKKFGRVQ